MRILIVIIIVLTTLAGFSQKKQGSNISKVNFEQSKYFKIEELGLYVGSTSTNIFYCDIRNGKVFLSIFSNNLELVELKKVNLPKRYQNLEIINIIKDDNELIITSLFNNKKIEKTIVFQESFDFDKLKSKDNFKKMFILNYLPNRDEYKIWKSISKLSDGYRIDFTGQNFPGKWSIDIFRIKEDSTERKKISIDISKTKGKLHKFESATVCNNGNKLAVLTRCYNSINDYMDVDLVKYNNYKEKVKTEVEKTNFSYQIIYIDLNTSDYQHIMLKQLDVNTNSNDFIKSLNLSDLGVNKILLTGAYSKLDNINARGLFSQVFDIKNIKESINITNKYEFSNDFILKYRTDDEIVDMNLDKSKGLPYDYFDYKQLKLIKHNDGYIVALEKLDNYLTHGRVSAGGTSTESIVFNRYYGDIFLMYLSSKGDIKDVIKIPRRQVQLSYNNIFPPSGTVKVVGDKTLIIFPTHDKKYTNYYHRLQTFAINNTNGDIYEDNLEIAKNLDKLWFNTGDIWLNTTCILSLGKNSNETKEKIVKFDFKKVLIGSNGE